MSHILSIIVPVYKVEAYLPSCIDSILNQSFIDFELILVDDGSPDKCGEICDKYALNDDRIKVIHQKNGGQSSARNAGLKIAKGKYVTFVDSDDEIDDVNTYKANVKILLENPNIDMIQFPTYRTDSGEKKVLYITSNEEIIQNIDVFQYWYQGRIINYSMWNKIIKREVIENIEFELGRIFEDIFFVSKIINKVRTVYLSNRGGYNYFVRVTSLTHSTNAEKMYYDALCAHCEIFNMATSYQELKVDNIEYFLKILRFYLNMKNCIGMSRNMPYNYMIIKKGTPNVISLVTYIYKNRRLKNTLWILIIKIIGLDFFVFLYIKMISMKIRNKKDLT